MQKINEPGPNGNSSDSANVCWDDVKTGDGTEDYPFAVDRKHR